MPLEALQTRRDEVTRHWTRHRHNDIRIPGAGPAEGVEHLEKQVFPA